MIMSSGPRSGTAISFRTKLLAAMMLVVSTLTLIGVYFAHRNVAATAQLDLVYPSAKDELQDLMQTEQQPTEPEAGSLHARFYRFLNADGAVLPPPNPQEVGELAADDEERLALKKLPDTQQTAYLPKTGAVVQPSVDEVIF